MQKNSIKLESRLKGIGLSDGCAVAKVCRLDKDQKLDIPSYTLATSKDVEQELQRTIEAFDKTKKQISDLEEEVRSKIGATEAGIFTAQILMLEDDLVYGKILKLVEEKRMNAEAAVSQVFEAFENQLLSFEDEHMRERASDFSDIKHRLLSNYSNISQYHPTKFDKNKKIGKSMIVVVRELTPSLTMKVDTAEVKGFITEKGGLNSHAAILARSMGIPAVSGIPNVYATLEDGTEVIIDGTHGEVIVWPSPETIEEKLEFDCMPDVTDYCSEPVEGYRVMGNISFSTQLDQLLEVCAEGVGLYRTEFELIARGRLMTEDELYERYSDVVQRVKNGPVIFRMFDIGSDKTLPFLDMPEESNPALGWRGTRLLLQRPEILKTQARAIARASVHGPVYVMYPMIIDVPQFLEVKALFEESIKDLECGTIHHGIMFEVPCACLAAKELFEVVDFASIGTNDLIQHLFAVDRNNERVAYDYSPDKPVFWNLIKSISDEAKAAGKHLSVCGELAGDPRYTQKFIDIGVSNISVSYKRISDVRKKAKSIISG
ncbi:MAG: phosphoenolpyruvate--protein phosphotransferase [Kiritimatiellae bacterium]|jgi:phosphotransferase system enzyme I (PtsI)|nr:phosphoenolpyruvate--protein phosphotransferase [Kiritimatiellia bacterium]